MQYPRRLGRVLLQPRDLIPVRGDGLPDFALNFGPKADAVAGHLFGIESSLDFPPGNGGVRVLSMLLHTAIYELLLLLGQRKTVRFRAEAVPDLLNEPDPFGNAQLLDRLIIDLGHDPWPSAYNEHAWRVTYINSVVGCLLYPLGL